MTPIKNPYLGCMISRINGISMVKVYLPCEKLNIKYMCTNDIYTNMGKLKQRHTIVTLALISLLVVLPVLNTSIIIKNEDEHDVRITNVYSELGNRYLGDINGDGYTDIFGKENDTLYGIFGNNIQNTSYSISNNYDMNISCNNKDVTLSMVGLTDINEDGYDDIVMRVYSHFYNDTNFAKVLIYYGRDTSQINENIVIDIYGNSQLMDKTINWATNCSRSFGADVVLVDFNGDGNKDIMIGDSEYNASNNDPDGGAIFFINTTTFFSNRILNGSDFQYYIKNRGLSEDPDYNIGSFSSQLSIIDFDGDGRKDLLWSEAGAGPGSRSQCGFTMVIYNMGINLYGEISIKNIPTTIILGAEKNDGFGGSLNVFDINGDGIDDLIIGSGGSDGPDNEYYQGGEIAILLGGNPRLPLIDLSDRNNIYFSIFGKNIQQIGLNVDIGYYNNDTIPDFLFSSSAHFNGPFAGACFLWLGDEITTRYITTDDCDFAFAGYYTEELKRYGRKCSFGDFNGDSWLDIICGPDKGRYFDIYFNTNHPPNPMNISVDNEVVYRGEENKLMLSYDDDRTPFDEIQCDVQINEGSGWVVITPDIIDEVNKTNIYDISPKLSSQTGNVSIRYNITDSAGLYTGWSYLNDSVVVMNNLPVITGSEVLTGKLNYGDKLKISVQVEDIENEISDLDLRLLLIDDQRHTIEEYDRTENEGIIFIEHEIDIHYQPGSYDVELILIDEDGGSDGVLMVDTVEILDSPTIISNVHIDNTSISRGSCTFIVFNIIDINDYLLGKSVSLDIRHQTSAFQLSESMTVSGDVHNLTCHHSIKTGKDWPVGDYSCYVVFDSSSYDLDVSFEVLNNAPEVLIGNRIFKINQTGEHSLDLVDLVFDYEDETELEWTIMSNPSPIDLHIQINDGISTLVADVDADIEDTYSITISASDNDGSNAVVNITLEINTTIPIVIITTIDYEFDIQGPYKTNNATTSLLIEFHVENTGNVPIDLVLIPQGNGSGYLDFMNVDTLLDLNGSIDIIQDFEIELREGTNTVGFGLLIKYNEFEYQIWDNETIIYEKENMTTEDNVSTREDTFNSILFLILIPIILIIIIVAIILVMRNKKASDEGSIEIPPISEQENMINDNSLPGDKTERFPEHSANDPFKLPDDVPPGY
ncbi:MAG: FG-GAP repeat protein [Thermoplasmata archaeon]|nr:FG-GAP repeat protein [Thermoplasmata archaeon]